MIIIDLVGVGVDDDWFDELGIKKKEKWELERLLIYEIENENENENEMERMEWMEWMYDYYR